MISLDKIREDLKDIRYYYARKKIFDSVSSDIGLSKVRDTVNLYNRTILMAPARLFDLYVCLYTKGCKSFRYLIIPKYFNAAIIAFSFSGGHFGCLGFSDFGLL